MPTHGPHKYGPTNLINQFVKTKAPVMEVICQKGRYSNVRVAATSIRNQLVKSKHRDKVCILVRRGRLFLMRKDLKNFIFPYGGEVYVDGKVVKLPRRELRRDSKTNLHDRDRALRAVAKYRQRYQRDDVSDGGAAQLPPESDAGEPGQGPGDDGRS